MGNDEGLGMGPVRRGIGLETRHRNDGVFGDMSGKLGFVLDPDKHISRKEALPGKLRDHADRDAIFRIIPDIAILDKKFFPSEIIKDFLMDAVKFFF